MRGHLGSRVSALLDGQLDPAEEESAWAHVHACHQCRDLVEREGWVKTRLAGLGAAPCGLPDSPSDSLRGSLLRPYAAGGGVAARTLADGPPPHLGARVRGALIGGGAVGVAVAGVLALGAAPADLPRRPAPADLSQVTPAPVAPSGAPDHPLLRTSVGGR